MICLRLEDICYLYLFFCLILNKQRFINILRVILIYSLEWLIDTGYIVFYTIFGYFFTKYVSINIKNMSSNGYSFAGTA